MPRCRNPKHYQHYIVRLLVSLTTGQHLRDKHALSAKERGRIVQICAQAIVDDVFRVDHGHGLTMNGKARRTKRALLPTIASAPDGPACRCGRPGMWTFANVPREHHRARCTICAITEAAELRGAGLSPRLWRFDDIGNYPGAERAAVRA